MRETNAKGFFVAIPTFDIGSLTALLAILVCFHGSEKGSSSGSEKNDFDTKCHYIMFSFAKQYCLLIWLTNL